MASNTEPPPAGRPLLTVLRPDWPAPERVGALSTLRCGGVSAGPWGLAGGAAGGLNLADHCGDVADAVAENRHRLRTLLPAEPRWLQQVHGTDVFDADAGSVRRVQGGAVVAEEAARGEVPRADAAVTTRRGAVLVVQTADCLPVLLCGRGGGAVGIAHAGWRGLACGVLERTLDELRRLQPRETDWLAWLGPAIGPARFEVGEEVRAAFVAAAAEDGDAFAPAPGAGKWFADLFELARRRLRRAGVRAVCGGGVCTATDAGRFYSYRRDRTTGRQASAVWLR